MSFPESIPVTRDEIVALMITMFGKSTVTSYLPVVDLALGMADGGRDFWQDPEGDHASEVARNLRFAAGELNNLADTIAASRYRDTRR